MAPSLKLLFRPKFQAYDIHGLPLAGGIVRIYEAGTSTPKQTYSDPALTVPNAWPVVLNSGGQADIWPGDGVFKIAVDDASGIQLYTQDNLRLDGDIISFAVGYSTIQILSNQTSHATGYGGLR